MQPDCRAPTATPPDAHRAWRWRLCASKVALWLVVPLVVPLAASAADDAASVARFKPEHGPPLLAQVHAKIGAALCQRDAQCRTIAIGQKACGGPQAYLAWSTQDTDADALARALANYNAWSVAAQSRAGGMSTCDVVIDPGAACMAVANALPSEATLARKACQLRSNPGQPSVLSQ